MRYVLTLLPVLMLLGGCARHLPEPVPCEIEGLRNCMQAGDLLFAGRPSREALALLAERGYRTVLNTQGLEELAWNEAAVVESLGMTYVSIPMPYPIHAISDDQVARFAELLEKGNRPMLLHCSSGNRVSGLWTVWLVEHAHVSADEALRLGSLAGHDAHSRESGRAPGCAAMIRGAMWPVLTAFPGARIAGPGRLAPRRTRC